MASCSCISDRRNEETPANVQHLTSSLIQHSNAIASFIALSKILAFRSPHSYHHTRTTIESKPFHKHLGTCFLQEPHQFARQSSPDGQSH
jgi:hypothetical protein